MRFNSVNTCECTDGFGWGVSLFTQGCPIHCKGCFNPETWDFNGGKPFTDNTQKIIIQLLKPEYITRFSILGGEPLYSGNIISLLELCKEIRMTYPAIKIWIWSGYTWEQIQERIEKAKNQKVEDEKDYHLRGLLSLIDYAVVGPFIEEEKDLTLAWRGSRNQEIIDVDKSLARGEKILHGTD